jgi:uncharacterized membrane protein YqjE
LVIDASEPCLARQKLIAILILWGKLIILLTSIAIIIIIIIVIVIFDSGNILTKVIYTHLICRTVSISANWYLYFYTAIHFASLTIRTLKITRAVVRNW